MKLNASQKKLLEKIGKKYKLKLILLHGSYANGTQKPGSDIDLAVLGKKELPVRQLLSLEGDFADVFGGERELDIKTLHRKDPLFLYQVTKNSQSLFGNSSDYNEFRAYAFKSFFDAKDLFSLEEKLIYKFQHYLMEKYG